MNVIPTALAKVVCFVRGHRVLPTGRHAILLREWDCPRCGGRYVSQRNFGRTLFRADADFDRLIKDYEDTKGYSLHRRIQ